jgi:catechol 2,3-dioxygenase-like lactoylglutathione lyase family enzyme
MAWLRHLALRCRDMERSREFYTEVIGLTFHDYRPQRDSMDLTDGTLNITLLSHPADAVRPPQVEGNEYIHFGIIVRDLAEVWGRAKDWGAEISKGDVKDRTKVEDLETVPECSFKILDPDGNVIDITANRSEWNCVTNLPEA